MRPAVTQVTPLDQGGVIVCVTVPTEDGDKPFEIVVERNEGHWHLAIPYVDAIEGVSLVVSGVTFTNGMASVKASSEEDK